MNELILSPNVIISVIAIGIAVVIFRLYFRNNQINEQLQLEYENQQAELKITEQNRHELVIQNEVLQARLDERENVIAQTQVILKQERDRQASSMAEIIDLKELIGRRSSLAESLQQQQTQQVQQLIDKEQELRRLNKKNVQLEQDLIQTRTTLESKEQFFIEQRQNFEESKQQLSVEFQNLANRILEEKSKSFSQSNDNALSSLLKPFREQIEGFQKRINEVHSESLKGNTVLESELKKVLDIGLNMSKEANNLTSALKGNKKLAGNWGEMQLERSLQLSGLVAGEHYSAQESFQTSDGKRRQPDFIIKLPDEKHIIIDSKVSLVDYERAVSNTDDKLQKQALVEHIKALRNHVADLSSKDYSNLLGMRSPNFVLMFVPIEPAYIEAMRLDPNLFNDAYNKNVIVVSHTTLMPILRTVANLWRIERGNQEAQEISLRAGEIYNQVSVVAERLSKVGSSLTALTNHYNSSVTALTGNQGLYGKVSRFKTLSAKATKSLPELDSIHHNIDSV